MRDTSMVMTRLAGVAAASALAICLTACAQAQEGPSSAGEAPAAPAASASASAESEIDLADTVVMGRYPQDSDAQVEWVVLDTEDDRVLLLARDCVDARPWNDTQDGSVTWEGSDLRAWLNGDFLREAFSDDERDAILTSDLSNGDDLGYGTPSGADTQDKVFLLSGDEVSRYLPSQESRTAEPTDYAAAQGAYTNDAGNCAWWLRSPGMTETSPAYIASAGQVGDRAHEEDETIIGVRPAMWVSRDYVRSLADGMASADSDGR